MIDIGKLIAFYEVNISEKNDNQLYLARVLDSKKLGDNKKPSSIWQIAIGVDPEKMKEAVRIIAEQLFAEHAPRLLVEFKGKTRSELMPVGSEVVLSFYEDVSTDEIRNLLIAIENALSQANILPDTRVNTAMVNEAPFQPLGASAYFSFRDKRVQVVEDNQFVKLQTNDVCFLHGDKLLVQQSYFYNLPVSERNNPQKLLVPFIECSLPPKVKLPTAMVPDTEPQPVPILLTKLEKDAFDELLKKIAVMKSYGNDLTKIDKTKGVMVETFAGLLEQTVNEFFKQGESKPSEAAWVAFKSDFTRTLHTKDPEMQAHRQAWKPLLANIALALTVFGAVLLLAKATSAALSEQGLTFNSALFFAKTKSEQKIDQIDVAWQQLVR